MVSGVIARSAFWLIEVRPTVCNWCLEGPITLQKTPSTSILFRSWHVKVFVNPRQRRGSTYQRTCPFFSFFGSWIEGETKLDTHRRDLCIINLKEINSTIFTVVLLRLEHNLQISSQFSGPLVIGKIIYIWGTKKPINKN